MKTIIDQPIHPMMLKFYSTNIDKNLVNSRIREKLVNLPIRNKPVAILVLSDLVEIYTPNSRLIQNEPDFEICRQISSSYTSDKLSFSYNLEMMSKSYGTSDEILLDTFNDLTRTGFIDFEKVDNLVYVEPKNLLLFTVEDKIDE